MAFAAPIAAAVVGTLTTVSTIHSIQSARAQGKFQQAAAQARADAARQSQLNQAAIHDYNAQIARQNAEQARLIAQAEAAEIRDDTRRRTSQLRARLAAGGVVTTAGSPLLAQVEQQFEGARDIEKRLYTGEIQAQGFHNQGILDTYKADISRHNADLARSSGLLNVQAIKYDTRSQVIGHTLNYGTKMAKMGMSGGTSAGTSILG